jgi:hypothetical protein
MLAAFGVDVLDPAVSVRRVHVLLERLPPHARTLGEQWSTEGELLAHLIDSVESLTWVTARAYGSNAPRPRPVSRPPLRDRGQAAAPARREAALSDGAPVQAASWAEAGMMIAGLPGVRVQADG